MFNLPSQEGWKKLSIIRVGLVVAGFGLWPVISGAAVDSRDAAVPAEVVQDILSIQGAGDIREIDCGQVTDEQFNDMGDMVMGTMIGNDEQHKSMDNMMGGEDSASLRAMHMNMGQQYLGCANDSSGAMGMTGGVMSMMGGGMGMMGRLSSGFGDVRGGDADMMGNVLGLGSAMGFGGGMLVFWVLVVVVIGLVVAWINRSQNKSGSSKAPLDILKERYAKGEIDKQEFETKKKDLI